MQVHSVRTRLIAMSFLTFFVMFSFLLSSSHATCWKDRNIEKIQQGLILKHFPMLRKDQPIINYCSAADFNGAAIGDYNSAQNYIRVMHGTTFPLNVLIAHELGHAQATRSGQKYSDFRGHGKVWLQAMVRAGFKEEAERTSNQAFLYPGLEVVYQWCELKRRTPPKRSCDAQFASRSGFFRAQHWCCFQ